ncbi:MAG: hypothetical protein AAGJ35_06910, partial [Myxococcota bacterium]
GRPVIRYETFTTGKKKGQEVLDENGLPIPVFARTKDGLCIPELDKDKKPLFVVVPKKDTKGNVIKDKKGNPLMQKAPLTDAVWERCYLPEWYKRFFPYKSQLRLGLDLQGGTHLVLRVDVEKALVNKTLRLADDLRKYLKKKKWIKDDKQVFHDPNSSSIELTIKDAGLVNKVRNGIEGQWEYLQTRPGSKASVYVVSFSEKYVAKARESAVEQAIETIRGRVDSLGVSEPSISKYGETQIVIQLPGLKNPKRAKKLIGKTAQLFFQKV